MGTIRKFQPKKVVVSTQQPQKRKVVVNNQQLTKKIKQVIDKNKEPKWNYEVLTLPDFTANQGYVYNITSKILAGDGINNRDGDYIHLNYLKGVFNLRWDKSVDGKEKINFRVMVARINGNPTTTTTFSTTNLPVHTPSNGVCSILDNVNGTIKVLYDKIHTASNQPLSTITHCDKIIRFGCKLNYKFKYDEGSTGSTTKRSTLAVYIQTDRAISTATAPDGLFEYLVGFKDI